MIYDEGQIRDIFATRLREGRKHARLTQDQLATAIEMSVDMVGRMERGSSQPSFETIARLSTALSVAPSFLFGSTDNSAQATLSLPQKRMIERVRSLNDSQVEKLEAVAMLLLS